MRTVLEIACTGSEIQNWIEVRRCDFGSDHATRVVGNAEYDRLDALVTENGYQFRTSLRRSGCVAVVVAGLGAYATTGLGAYATTGLGAYATTGLGA